MPLDSRMTRLGTCLGWNSWNRVKHLVAPNQTVYIHMCVCVCVYLCVYMCEYIYSYLYLQEYLYLYLLISIWSWPPSLQPHLGWCRHDLGCSCQYLGGSGLPPGGRLVGHVGAATSTDPPRRWVTASCAVPLQGHRQDPKRCWTGRLQRRTWSRWWWGRRGERDAEALGVAEAVHALVVDAFACQRGGRSSAPRPQSTLIRLVRHALSHFCYLPCHRKKQ